ncbi:MAG: cyclic nucleotide-binding domain-containing protein [Deltaproteobacteria bacterium]|nr:cyclic nucleotide-binding domain-containing protein [Deltaproteobacteria bacterium]
MAGGPGYEDEVVGSLLLQMLDEQARERVLGLARVETYRKGTAIVAEGTAGGDIFLLRIGQVKVQTLQAGLIVELATLRPGQIFGEVAVVNRVPRTASVVALTDVELLRFDGDALVAELRKHPQASALLDRIVAHRAADTVEKTWGWDS